MLFGAYDDSLLDSRDGMESDFVALALTRKRCCYGAGEQCPKSSKEKKKNRNDLKNFLGSLN